MEIFNFSLKKKVYLFPILLINGGLDMIFFITPLKKSLFFLFLSNFRLRCVFFNPQGLYRLSTHLDF